MINNKSNNNKKETIYTNSKKASDFKVGEKVELIFIKECESEYGKSLMMKDYEENIYFIRVSKKLEEENKRHSFQNDEILIFQVRSFVSTFGNKLMQYFHFLKRE